jgi:hypothetical protein
LHERGKTKNEFLPPKRIKATKERAQQRKPNEAAAVRAAATEKNTA